jgi:hypothetical protein
MADASQLLVDVDLILRERTGQYDQRGGERSMGRAVAAFNEIKGLEVLSESDGWLLMALLKMVRDQSRAIAHEDSCKDLIGYAALYGESRLKGAGNAF